MKLKHQRIIEKAVFGINVEETDKSLLYRHGLCALSFLSFSRGHFPLSTTYFVNYHIQAKLIVSGCNNWVIETTGIQESIPAGRLDISDFTLIQFIFDLSDYEVED